MPATYEPIVSTTLGSGSSSITFGSIPSTYTDLRLTVLGSANGSSGSTAFSLRFNGVTSSVYSRTDVEGNGTSPSAARTGTTSRIYVNGYINYETSLSKPSFVQCDIFDYTSTNKKKSGLIFDSADFNGSGVAGIAAFLFQSTSAISSLTLDVGSTGGDTWLSGTTATLYGILKA